jgi:membrane-associated phospholipid phosphatase
VHVDLPIGLDRDLTGGHVPTVVLQDAFYDHAHVRWWDTLTSVVYASHFFVAWTIAVVLYLRSREEWARWVRRLLVLSYACLTTFVAFPAAPPWYAAKHGALDPVARITGRGFDAIRLHAAGTLLERGQAAVNNVAAFPSLHAGLPLLITLFFWPRVRAWARVALLAYTVAMALALVYGGEHYVADVLAGYAYVVATMLAVGAWERRRRSSGYGRKRPRTLLPRGGPA